MSDLWFNESSMGPDRDLVKGKAKVGGMRKRALPRTAGTRRRRLWRLLASLAAVVAALAAAGQASPCLALDNAATRATLKDLPGVYLMVEDVRLEIEEDGLTRNEIHQTALKRLESAGIRLLSEAEWRDIPGSPWLYLYAHVMRREFVEERVYVFNISIELKQKAALARTPDAEPVFATTWEPVHPGEERLHRGHSKGHRALPR